MTECRLTSQVRRWANKSTLKDKLKIGGNSYTITYEGRDEKGKYKEIWVVLSSYGPKIGMGSHSCFSAKVYLSGWGWWKHTLEEILVTITFLGIWLAFSWPMFRDSFSVWLR